MGRITVRGTVLTIVVLLALLGASVGVALWVWWEIGQAQISRHGFIALGLGAGLTFALGAGLMALMFFSARRGYDDRAAESERVVLEQWQSDRDGDDR
jgi:hypothetical protein